MGVLNEKRCKILKLFGCYIIQDAIILSFLKMLNAGCGDMTFV